MSHADTRRRAAEENSGEMLVLLLAVIGEQEDFLFSLHSCFAIEGVTAAARSTRE
jgi:hypothetical protein